MSEEKEPSRPVRFKFTVTLLRAKNLPISDLPINGGRADPYVIFRLGKDGKPETSKVKTNTLNPNWGDECFSFEVKEKKPLICTVVDKDNRTADDLIGTVEIDTGDILSHPDEELDYEILSKQNKRRGTLTLKFHFQSRDGKDAVALRPKVKSQIRECQGRADVPFELPRPEKVEAMTLMQLLYYDEKLSDLLEKGHGPGGQDDEDNRFIQKLKDLGVKVVVFDMDRTACKLHSGGVLDKTKVPNYIKNASPDFKRIVPKLIAKGFQMAIATFTDKIYYERFPKARYRAGEDLVTEFLNGVFSDPAIVGKFFIVAYFPDLHDDKHKRNKSYHIQLIMSHYGIDKKPKVILFDDTLKNVEDAKKDVHAYKANPRAGFKLGDLLDAE